MTFPNTPRDVKVELFIAAAWVDITADVYVRDLINITRGRGDEQGSAQPSTLTLTLNNRNGKYSPRNPLGTYYGKIGRNTQIRVSVNSGVRFIGEVSSWPGRWDTSGKDAYMPIEAAGILRRLGQWNHTVSGYRQFLLSTSPVTYWPCDDGSDSDRCWPVAGTYQGSSIHREVGTAVFTLATGILGTHLAPTLRINDTVPAAGGDRMIGYCRGSAATPDAVALDMLWRVDTEVVPAGTLTSYPTGNFHIVLYLNGASTAASWDMSFRHDGTNDDIELFFTDTGGTTSLGNTAALTAVQDTALHHIRLLLDQNGADVDYTIYIDGVSVLTGTKTTFTLPAVDSMAIVYDRNSNTADGLLNIGHVIVWENLANIPNITTTAGLSHGFAGEAAGRRIERLCGETGIPFASTGNLDDTIDMGLQFEDELTSQFAEIEQTDMGLIYEPRTSFALGYRTRTSLYTLAATATLDMSALQLAMPFEPVEDDQGIRNDVFAQRREGSSFQATRATGPLSVLDPPNGVGRYKDEVGVNSQTDGMLEGIANWLLTLGTIDEARYPRITVDLAISAVATNSTLSAALLSADVGSRLDVTDAVGVFVYDDIKLLVLGYSETIGPYEHTVTFNCAPYSPYDIAKFDTDRFDTAGSQLSGSVTTTASSLSVADTGGTLWTTSVGGGFDITVGGERMTVTAISGASSPQTFTVTRSVNGVVKAHAAGTSVRLFKTPRYGLGN